jgi:hypothetical protein
LCFWLQLKADGEGTSSGTLTVSAPSASAAVTEVSVPDDTSTVVEVPPLGNGSATGVGAEGSVDGVVYLRATAEESEHV